MSKQQAIECVSPDKDVQAIVDQSEDDSSSCSSVVFEVQSTKNGLLSMHKVLHSAGLQSLNHNDTVDQCGENVAEGLVYSDEEYYYDITGSSKSKKWKPQIPT